MPHSVKVLVVGTTPDYVDLIRKRCPERALFITDPALRQRAQERSPRDHEEILCGLEDNEEVLSQLLSHMEFRGQQVDGVACFDCESLSLASFLAQRLSLPFPSPDAVHNCRSKSLSKLLWQEKNVMCPVVKPVTSVKEALTAFREFNGNLVLKPISSSGSELVFHCRTEKECADAFKTIKNGISKRADHMLYKNVSSGSPEIIGEEFIDAAEFSCDFLLVENRARIIRLSRKLSSKRGPFGTIMGYAIVDNLDGGVGLEELSSHMAKSAMALGLKRSICMADFMIRDKNVILLEITPRPGGDCLPSLLFNAYNLDILSLTLDFAQRRTTPVISRHTKEQFVGVRIHAETGGVLRKLDFEQLSLDSRVREIYFRRSAGDIIRMPPEDYESFLLGHIIVSLPEKADIERECALLMKKVFVEIEKNGTS